MSASMAEVLAAHSFFLFGEEQNTGESGSFCECGAELCPGVEYAPPAFAAHQAEVLGAEGYGLLADAWDAAVKEAESLGWMHAYGAIDTTSRNPYERNE